MKTLWIIAAMLALTPAAVTAQTKTENAKGDRLPPGTVFRTSERCVSCHNGMKTGSGEDVSIGLQWEASIMANSARDPYWQGSIRRETMEHPESSQEIQDDCSMCHMAAVRLTDRDAGKHTNVFSRLPLAKFPNGDKAAADGVTCSVCHQIEKQGLGTDATFNGNVAIAPADKYGERPEYGPFEIDHGHQTVMHSSTATYRPVVGEQMRDSALCASCHTLYTTALGPNGKAVGRLAEQVPYQEWQHSDYATTQSCQECHMPVVKEAVPITALYGQPREGLHRHVFVGDNFLMEAMLQDHREELAVVAPPEELDAAMKRTAEFLKTQAARVTVGRVEKTGDGLAVDVHVENMGGHKLPTAYPSRRVWLHVVVKDSGGRVVFESGALNADGSIVGNDNDEDPGKFEPHYREITRPDQVEIYEPILVDADGKVTTGLLAAVAYAKDNRLLPHGFDKASASKDVEVRGGALDDPAFTDHGSTVRYAVSTNGATGPFKIEAEVWFQPIGFRWAHNLEAYDAKEPQRMVKYFEQASRKSALMIARAETSQ